MDQQREELIKNMEKENLPTTSSAPTRAAPKSIQKPPGFEISTQAGLGPALNLANSMSGSLAARPPGLSEW